MATKNRLAPLSITITLFCCVCNNNDQSGIADLGWNDLSTRSIPLPMSPPEHAFPDRHSPKSIPKLRFDSYSGFVGFNVPLKMTVGQSETVSVAVIKSRLRAQLLKSYPELSIGQIDAILVSSRMKAALYAIPRKSFDIEPHFGNAIRSILDERATVWEWEVTPQAAGRGTLSFHIISVSRLSGSTEEGPSWVRKFSLSVHEPDFDSSNQDDLELGDSHSHKNDAKSAAATSRRLVAAPPAAPPNLQEAAALPPAAPAKASGHASTRATPIESLTKDKIDSPPESAEQDAHLGERRLPQMPTPDDGGAIIAGDGSGNKKKSHDHMGANGYLQKSSIMSLLFSMVSLFALSVFVATIRFWYIRKRPFSEPQSGSHRDATMSIENKAVPGSEHSQTMEVVVPRKSSKPERIKILFLSANPRATTRLRLDEEVREIQEWLSRAQYERAVSGSNAQDYLELATEWAVRVTDLQFLLQKHRPHILHFSGHGARSSEIILEDQTGSAILVPAEALSRLLSILKDNLRCVVLNACYTQNQASGIAQAIDCVVGMSRTVQDQTAIQFAAAFYQALAFGRTLKEAFALGQIQAQLIGQQDHDVPQLITRVGVDAEEVRLLNCKLP